MQLLDEDLRFRHPAQHNKRDGVLSISGVRILWEGHGGERVELSWANVESCKYSPESHHSALLRVTHTQAQKPDIFTLTGGTQQQNYAALMECKQRIVEITNERSIVSQVASIGLPNATSSSSSSTAATTLTGPLPGTTEWKSQQLPQRKKSRIESALDGAMLSAQASSSSSSSLPAEAVQRQRAKLLLVDKQLRQKYDELVTSGIVSDEEFWSQQRALGRGVGSGDDGVGTTQGQTSTMWVDVLSQYVRKDKNGVEEITLTGEAIHQIFTLFPAVRRAHQEKVPVELTEEQFWRRLLESEYYNRNIRARPTTDRSNMLTDDMFAKYARTDDTQPGDADTQHKRVKVQHPDVDLTATVQDHILYAQPEVDEELPGSKGREREQRIIKKYNKHSQEVLRSQRVTKISPDIAEPGTELVELEKPAEPNYVPLKLNTPAPDADVREAAADGTGQGPSWSMGELSSSLAKCFPSTSIAQLVLTTDTQRMASATEASRAAMQAAAAGSEGRASLHSNGDDAQRRHPKLPQSFVNSYRQRYEMQAELLRHFYAAERQLDRQPHAREKCRKIADKLQNEVDVLLSMKRTLREKEDSHAQERFLQAMIDQLHRALDLWERTGNE